jgi:hypothetical protein
MLKATVMNYLPTSMRVNTFLNSAWPEGTISVCRF